MQWVALEEIVGKWLISHALWPSRSPNLNMCNYYLWGTLKDRVYMNNPQQLQQLKNYIQGEIQSILKQEIHHVSSNFLEDAGPA
jgi:hypothetical protein